MGVYKYPIERIMILSANKVEIKIDKTAKRYLYIQIKNSIHTSTMC